MSYYCLDCGTEFDVPTIKSVLSGDCKESQDIEYIEVCPCCDGENYNEN